MGGGIDCGGGAGVARLSDRKGASAALVQSSQDPSTRMVGNLRHEAALPGSHRSPVKPSVPAVSGFFSKLRGTNSTFGAVWLSRIPATRTSQPNQRNADGFGVFELAVSTLALRLRSARHHLTSGLQRV